MDRKFATGGGQYGGSGGGVGNYLMQDDKEKGVD